MTRVEIALTIAFVVIAAMYAAVGHAGASGYIAAMALVGIAPETIKPTALALNIMVGSIGCIRFASARLIPWRDVWPLVLGGMPLAWYGASLPLAPEVYKSLLAVLLLWAGIELARTASRTVDAEASTPLRRLHWSLGLVSGGAIGIVAGLTGTGGAIFLTPILLFARFATTRIAAGMSIVFVLANSIAGLASLTYQGDLPTSWPQAMPVWAAAVAIGALIGTALGRGGLGTPNLRRVLAIVLFIAAGKLAFG